MIIEKIDIKSFGALTNTTLEFTDTVNVIEGQNEAGKTTIAAFIKYMLYGFAASTEGEELSERKKRINWTTGTAQGSMIVRVKGKRYLINRTTVPSVDGTGRETYKEDSSIIDLDTGTTSFGKLPSGEVFFDVSRELFENTAFVGQIGDSSINKGSVVESIENILFSANERMNTERAAEKISEKMDELLHRSGQGGIITELERKRDELAIQLARSDEENKKILSKETELFRIREERREAEERLDKLRDLDDCYKNVILIQTFDQLHALEEESAAKAEAYNSFIRENTHAGYTPTEAYLTDIAIARRSLADARRALSEAEEVYLREKNAIGITKEIESAIAMTDDLGGEDEVLAGAKKHRGGVIRNIALTVATSLGVIAALVYEAIATGFFGELLMRILVGVLGAGCLGGVVTFVVMMLRDKKRLGSLISTFEVESYADLLGKLDVIREARMKRDGMIRSTENARLAVERCRLDFDNANTELTRVVVRWGEEPTMNRGVDEFLDRLTAKVSAFLERRNILFEEKNSIELTVREIRRTLSDKNEIDIRAQVHPVKRKALANYNHDQITKGISDLKERIVECEREAFAVESELISLRARAGDPALYKIKLVELETRISELRQKYQSYKVALTALETGTDNLRARVSPRLGEYATELMSIMTDKKYNGFSVTKGIVVTYTNENGEEKSVDFLSGGTRDLAYIAVRLALIDMLYEDKPPIVFDETFAHQDNVRAQAMMRALSRLADEGYQSFIFTCRNREAALASELVSGAGIYRIGE